MGKWNKMGKDSNKDVIVCPRCKGIFIRRRLRACPLCKVTLIYPGEYVNSENDGYIWLTKWVKIKDAKVKEWKKK